VGGSCRWRQIRCGAAYVAPTSCGQSYRTQSQDLFRMCSSSKCISGYDWHWCAQCLSVAVHGNDYWDYREGCALPACARRPSANSDTDQTAGVVPCAAATCRPRLFSAPPTSRHRRHSQRHQGSLAMPRTPAPAPPAGRERRPLRTPSAGSGGAPQRSPLRPCHARGSVCRWLRCQTFRLQRVRPGTL
jgi:hypothetical protein